MQNRSAGCFPATEDGLAGRERVVARAGFEPATFHFSGERCYQLSYLAMEQQARRSSSM